MAELIFELGRGSAFIGIFFFLIFGAAFFSFKRQLTMRGLSLTSQTPEAEGDAPVALELGEIVHYLRRREYEHAHGALPQLGGRFRPFVVYPFFLGVWAFCLGLALMSMTFGFVLLS